MSSHLHWLSGAALLAMAAMSVCLGAEPDAKATKAPKALSARVETAAAPDEDGIRKALELPVSTEVTDAPLHGAIRALSEAAKIEIRLDNRALTDIGVAPDTPVTFHHKGLRLRQLLELMLHDLGLTWLIKGQVLLITTPDVAASIIERRIYDVRDLVAARDENGQPVNDFDQLLEVITATIMPTTWDHVGGPGSLATFETDGAAVLVVSQNWQTHEEIERLLEDLRAAPKNKTGEGAPRRTVKPVTRIICPVCEKRRRAADAKPPEQPFPAGGDAKKSGEGMF